MSEGGELYFRRCLACMGTALDPRRAYPAACPFCSGKGGQLLRLQGGAGGLRVERLSEEEQREELDSAQPGT